MGRKLYSGVEYWATGSVLSFLIMINGITQMTAIMSTEEQYGVSISWDGNTVSWYGEKNSEFQFNFAPGVYSGIYNYIAFG